MSKKLFVGNIDWDTNESQLRELFEKYGTLKDLVIVNDYNTGRPKGFGFVTFEQGEEADKAISELDGFELGGRKLVVNEARAPKKNGSNGGGYRSRSSSGDRRQRW